MVADASREQVEINQLVRAGLDDGRIPGKETADWLRSQGLVALKGYLDGAPAIAGLAATQTDGKPPADDKDAPLSGDDLVVCRAMGLDPKDYKATQEAA